MNRLGDEIELPYRRRSGNYEEIRNIQMEHNRRSLRRPNEYRQARGGIEYVPVTEDDVSNSSSQMDHVTEIVRHMEQDEALMQDNPISEQLRMETLRDMPQCLTMKRSIKAKLTKSVSKKSKHSPLGLYKQCRYRLSMAFAKFHMYLKDIFYSFELWYSALKSIEGYFGSGVATYFRFLRLLFISNILVCIPVLGFLVVPQVLYSFSGQENTNDTSYQFTDTCNNNNNTINVTLIRNRPFDISNIITGEGYFTNTALYYGYYTNKDFATISTIRYNMPFAYFFTMLFLYAITFIVFSIRMAKSYKHNFIETSGGLKNVYAHKVFCGWDYSIATKEGAELKSTAIYNELKELLSTSDNDRSHDSCKRKFWTTGIQIVCHLFIFTLLGIIAFTMWQLLKNYRVKLVKNDSADLGSTAVVTSIVITLIMNLGPLLFTWIVKFEDYKNPKTTLYISLIRTFLLEIVVIGVLLVYWLRSETDQHCWETLFGQEIYRLVFIDFLFSLLFALITEVLRHVIYKYWPRIGIPEFDIARHTLQIIYNQTLFWMGLYFSPLLAVILTIKFWFTWYIKQVGCLYFCRPSSKSWRAAQTQTLFLVMTFFALFLVIVCIGYIVIKVDASRMCGPFRDYCHMYQLLSETLEIQDEFIRFLLYLTKPGVITGLLIAMGVWVYYIREKSLAQKGMVDLLQEMLITEAKDKEFLLSKISQITDGKWMYNLKRTFGRSKLYSEPSSTWRYKPDFTNIASPSTHHLEQPDRRSQNNTRRFQEEPYNEHSFEPTSQVQSDYNEANAVRYGNNYDYPINTRYQQDTIYDTINSPPRSSYSSYNEQENILYNYNPRNLRQNPNERMATNSIRNDGNQRNSMYYRQNLRNWRETEGSSHQETSFSPRTPRPNH